MCIKQTDTDGREIYHWNTDLFQKFSVGEGMECNEQLAEENMDVITQLLVKMDAVDTRTSTEAMRSYVSEYMTENPPQPSDEQANAGMDAYMTENGQDYVNTYMGENAQSAVLGGILIGVARGFAKHGNKFAQDVCKKINIEYEMKDDKEVSNKTEIGFHA